MKFLDQDTKIRVMHGLRKFHKCKIHPLPHRKLVAIVGSRLHVIRRWVGAYLKQFLPYHKTCMQISDDVLNNLKDVKTLNEDYFINTCDVETVHPNTKTEECLEFLIAALDAHIFKVRTDWPSKQLLSGIELLLKCDVFRFNDTYFRKI